MLKNCSRSSRFTSIVFSTFGDGAEDSSENVSIVFSVFDLRMLFDKLSNLRRGHRAGLTRYFDAVLEQRHRRDRGNMIAVPEGWHVFGIHLCDD